MAEPELQYTFTCPSCSGSFSIVLDRIPPVQARFKCPHCRKPMDFPSREEARIYAQLQARSNGRSESAPLAPTPSVASAPAPDSAGGPPDAAQFRVEKKGFETDMYDRRGIRNLIRTGELEEHDRIRMDDGEPRRAIELPYLKSLFKLRKNARATPPAGCRTHTNKIAHFRCTDTGRPLCEECAPEKKFGGTVIRVCQHCGGTAAALVTA